MDQIKWCLNQKKGIEIVEPSDNLRDAYLVKAEDALDTLKTSKSRDWQLTTAYYTIYNSIYSLLMKIGIKCEIHSCTIEFTKRYLKDHFTPGNLFSIIKIDFDLPSLHHRHLCFSVNLVKNRLICF